ncbi:MAG TPA: glycosyltransferase family 2 protein [Phenylobacterium sp.]|uniref:glycosyltransferase family 2 protein n=1 Tax=Phenylobacterium sp. TaxID=1871053 RepID=UPI002B46CB94|nr:glycosyltransferase family 2 protein [Phenylobacterium sp.]HKR87507.1 glycosyltransferase family 2 protein [Phenylobacterium sp.]
MSAPVEPLSFAPRERATSAALEASAADLRKRALIVIPTLNEAAVIAKVLARVLDDDGLVDPLVVVADGGSRDGTRAIVGEIARRDPRVRLVHNPSRLQSAGLNLAAATVGGDRPWLVRVDAHADYPKNYASSLIAEALRTGASSVVVSMLTVGVTPFQRGAAAAQNTLLGAGGSPHRVGGAGRWVDHGHHALFSLAAFEAAGGYDETFSHNEDAEFDLRLTRQGGRIWLTDKVRIGYHPRGTPAALWKQYFSYGKGRARTALKHYVPLKLRQVLPLAVAPAALGALLSPLFWPLAVPALAWAAGAVAFGAALALLQGDAAVLLAGPAAMIMHLAWSAGFWTHLLAHGGQRWMGKLRAPARHAVS